MMVIRHVEAEAGGARGDPCQAQLGHQGFHHQSFHYHHYHCHNHCPHLSFWFWDEIARICSSGERGKDQEQLCHFRRGGKIL